MALAPGRAEAVPAFAKAVNAECTLCHSSWPKLNEVGIAYRANGYRMEGDAGSYIWDKPVPLGLVAAFAYENTEQESVAEVATEEHAEETPAVVTMRSARAGALEDDGMGGMAEVAAGPSIMTTKNAGFEFQYLLVYAAGTLAPHVSYLAHLQATKEQTTVELANIAFMDILPDAGLNIRAGKMSADLPFFSSARKLTSAEYLLQFQTAGGHGHGAATALPGVSITSEGVEAFGRASLGDGAGLEYALGLGNDKVETAENSAGAYYGLLSLTYAGQNLGFLYRSDRIGENESERQTVNGYAVAGSLNHELGSLTAAYAGRTVEGLAGEAETKSTSATLEGIVRVAEGLNVLGRYDWLDPQDSKEESRQYVASLLYYVAPNARVQLEYAKRTDTDHDGVDLNQTAWMVQTAFGF